MRSKSKAEKGECKKSSRQDGPGIPGSDKNPKSLSIFVNIMYIYMSILNLLVNTFSGLLVDESDQLLVFEGRVQISVKWGSRPHHLRQLMRTVT